MAIYIKADSPDCPTCDLCAANTPCPRPQITSGLGPYTLTRYTSFSYQITATGNPTSFNAVTLPSGMSINTSTGTITGTLPDCGTLNINISATNACGTDTELLELNVTGPSPAITSASTVAIIVDEPFSFFITATNTPTSFGSTALPPGLNLNTSTGEIYGTPSGIIDYSVDVSASNACGTGTGNLFIYITSHPVLMCDSIEAMHVKQGFSENEGYESSPPKIYLKLSASGTLYQDQWEGPDCDSEPLPSNNSAYSGYQEYDEDYNFITDAIAINGTVVPGIGNLVTPCGDLECVPVDTATTRTYTGDEVCYEGYPSFKYSGSVVSTMSDEFTTSELIAKTISELPSYPNTFDGDCSSYRDLSSNELSYTVRRVRYKFGLPNLTGFTTFRIDWLQGSTPLYYIWNGTDTETGVYTMNEPATNGFTYVSSIVVTAT